ncbi:MAG: hypothetical protein ABUS57_00560 [Pseudomonadota bacterium]
MSKLGTGTMRRLYFAGVALAVMAASSAPVAAQAQLRSYTAPDQSASASVPTGWQVTQARNGVIMMSGPHGEQIGLGEGIFVRDSAAQARRASNVQVRATMPYGASLAQKFAMLWQQASAANGMPAPQVSIISSRPIQIAPAIGECGVFLGTMTAATGTAKFETQFCSLRPDSAGIFKLIWNNAQVPEALATQERAIVEAVLHSYRPSRATLQLIMQPATPQAPPPGPNVAVGGGMSSAYWGAIGADHSAECMDLGVIREVPEWRLPPYCR